MEDRVKQANQANASLSEQKIKLEKQIYDLNERIKSLERENESQRVLASDKVALLTTIESLKLKAEEYMKRIGVLSD